ncbi:ESPR-type extended signal peptide-containing protein [Mitsuokella sp. WILCCON 0060]|uniref:ESPR-type extended signal peptide-containing protein n=1 Tax=Mitsuokella sp. WILCCON 0060 TaxID=3345341 RepID=UPI003F1DD7C2
MNHIYKVVWSKVRGCYIVVSEIAKSNGKSRSQKAAVLGAVFMGTVLITGAGILNPVEAAGYSALNGTANTDNSIAIGNNTTAGNSSNNASAIAIGEYADATSANAIAIGFGQSNANKTTASNESAIAIGTNVTSSGQRSIALGAQTKAEKDSSVAIGYDTHATNDSTVAIGSGTDARGRYSVAIGLSSVAGTTTNNASNPLDGGGSVALGYIADAEAGRSIAIGTASTAQYSTFSTALGDSSNAQTEGSVALGAGSIATRAAGNKEQTITETVDYNTGVTTTKTLGNELTAYLKPDTVASGQESTWTSTTGAVSVGGESTYKVYENGVKVTKTATLTRQITNVAAGSEDTDAVNVAQLKAARITVTSSDNSVGITTTKDDNDYHTNYDLKVATATLSAGTDGKITNLNPTVTESDGKSTTNTQAYVTGDDVADAINNSGFKLTTSNSDGTASGTSTELINPGETVTLDAGKNIALAQNGNKISIATSDDMTLGKANSTDGSGNTVAGTNGRLAVDNTNGSSVVIGKDAVSKTSSTSTVAQSGIGVNGTDGTTNGVSMWAEGSGTSTKGHIGLTGSDGAFTDIWIDYGTKTLNSDKNTTADTASRLVYTDTKGNHEVATMDDGLKFKGDDATVITKKLNEQLEIVGGATGDLTDNNIAVKSTSDGKLKVQLAKDLTDLNSVSVGNTTINTSGLAITNGPSITASGVDAGSKVISNVADGVANNDAVNVSQLNAVNNKASQHSSVKAGSTNVTVLEGTNAAGGTEYTVDLSNKVTLGTDASKQVSIDGTNGTVTVGQNGTQVKLDSTDGSVTAGSVTINKDGKGTVNGLTNKTWNSDSYTSGQAATEDQLHQVEQNAKSYTDSQITNVNSRINQISQQHTTVSVNNNSTSGNLVLNKTNATDTAGANYDISLSNNVTIGSAGTNGQNGTLTVTSADGTKSVKADGENGQLTFKDGSNTASLKAAAAAAGVDGTSINRVAVDNHAVATLADGMKFAGDTGAALTQTLNSTTNIKGGVADTSNLSDNNIGVVSDGNDTLTVKLAKDLQGLNSVDTATLNATTVNAADVNAANVKATTVAADTVNGSTFNAGNTTINSSGLTVKSDDGSRALTVQDGNVSMGGNQIHNVAAGTADDDAVNVSQLKKMGGEISNVSRRVDRVGAGAAALAALHPQDFDPDDKWDFAVGYGNYRGANAAAVGAFYQPNEDTTLSIGGTVGGGENMINAGISFKFGQGNHVTNSRVAMAKEILALKDYVEKQDAEIQQLKALVGSQSGETKKRSLLFPDVPENHWAYSYVKKLADRGLLEGFPDGEFKGDRLMTRYEFAAIFERALENGVTADADLQHMADEFDPEIRELSLNRFRVDRVSGDDNSHNKIERVRVNSRDEIVQQKNGTKSTIYRDSYGGQIEKSAAAAK